MDAFFFWIFSAGMIGCGLAVILNRNPVASALCFATTIVFMSGLFVLLSAFFLAAVQILVTAGAVMVLFLFIIMLLNPEAMEHMPRQKVWMACSMVLALGFVFLVARTLEDMPQGRQTLDSLPTITAQQSESQDSVYGATGSASPQAIEDHWDDTHQIGRLLFTKYVAPFEITSLLILVATIGVIVLCKRDEPTRTAPNKDALADMPTLGKHPREPAATR
jgi:NADH-quinone oxidoreductase subunit J